MRWRMLLLLAFLVVIPARAADWRMVSWGQQNNGVGLYAFVDADSIKINGNSIRFWLKKVSSNEVGNVIGIHRAEIEPICVDKYVNGYRPLITRSAVYQKAKIYTTDENQKIMIETGFINSELVINKYQVPMIGQINYEINYDTDFFRAVAFIVYRDDGSLIDTPPAPDLLRWQPLVPDSMVQDVGRVLKQEFMK